MSPLLFQFSRLFKSFGSLSLFENISLSIHQGDLFALIGENGAGKTTLLQIVAAAIPFDSGIVSKKENLTVGYLPQEIFISDPSLSVRLFLEDKSYADLEHAMASCLDNPDRLHEWEQLHEKYEQLGGYRRIPLEQAIEGLKLEKKMLDVPMQALSSGQRMRAALAKIMIANPDLLLLDEPTNHLDQEMIQWLEKGLEQRKGASVLVSHDRKFLNNVCNRLIEIKERKLTCYGGGYDFYLAEQQRLLERQIKAYEAQEEEKNLLKQKIKALSFSKRKPSAPSDRNVMAYDKRGEKHQKALQHKLDSLKAHLAQIEQNSLTHPRPKTIKGLHFVSNPFFAILELNNIHRTICKGDRIVITGPNGCGKTTLLKAIADQIRQSSSIKIAYLDQEVELLPMDQTPLHYFESKFQLSEEALRSELHKAAMGGCENLIKRPFKTLSTGQRKRLMLLSLILEKPNLLLLDEPTNHLDFMTLEALEKALVEFEGAIVSVSHDLTYIKKVATQEWQLFNSF